jgi:hypothetical protein
MATYNGANYGYSLSANPGGIPGAGGYMGPEWEGKVRAIYDTYTFAGEVSGSLVNVGVLRAGEVFLGSEIINAALGSGTTIQLGDAGDDDRYMTAQSSVSTGNIIGKEASTGLGYKATADTIIQLKTGGGACTGQVKITIWKACSN